MHKNWTKERWEWELRLREQNEILKICQTDGTTPEYVKEGEPVSIEEVSRQRRARPGGIQPDTKMIQILRRQIEIGIGFVENVPLAYGLPLFLQCLM